MMYRSDHNHKSQMSDERENELVLVGQTLLDMNDSRSEPGYVRLYRNNTHEFRVVVDYDYHDNLYKVLSASSAPLGGATLVQFFHFMANFGRPMLLEDVVKLAGR